MPSFPLISPSARILPCIFCPLRWILLGLNVFCFQNSFEIQNLSFKFSLKFCFQSFLNANNLPLKRLWNTFKNANSAFKNSLKFKLWFSKISFENQNFCFQILLKFKILFPKKFSLKFNFFEIKKMFKLKHFRYYAPPLQWMVNERHKF